jgi:hypothetical protein
MKCIQKEFPNKLDHVNNDPEDVRSPRAMHPAFYGCFDWHSTVHGHWMLVHLLKLFPNLPEARGIRAALDANLSEKNIAGEVAYLKQANRASFERTYGWAWLLMLQAELTRHKTKEGRVWSAKLQPLADLFARRFREHLPEVGLDRHELETHARLAPRRGVGAGAPDDARRRGPLAHPEAEVQHDQTGRRERAHQGDERAAHGEIGEPAAAPPAAALDVDGDVAGHPRIAAQLARVGVRERARHHVAQLVRLVGHAQAEPQALSAHRRALLGGRVADGHDRAGRQPERREQALPQRGHPRRHLGGRQQQRAHLAAVLA